MYRFPIICGEIEVYLLIGCDDFGFSLLESLKKRGVRTVVIDDGKLRIEHLRRLGYREEETICGDPASLDVLKRARIHSMDVIIISLNDFSKVKAILSAIRKLKEQERHLKLDPVVIVRVEDEAEADEVKELGASDTFPANQLMASSAISAFDRLKLMVSERRISRKFEQKWKDHGKLAIVLQTNPDPDGIASGMALKLYAKAKGVDADIIYDGVIGHPQNRALVNLLGVELFQSHEVDFRNYRWHALVDVSTSAHCALPPNITPFFVIDHHTAPSSEVSGIVVEITPVAATSTIMTNFLRFAGIEPDPSMAAALFLGLLTDTMKFARNFTSLDLETFEYLNMRMDRDIYAKLTSPELVPEHIQIFLRALKASKVYGDFRFANLGEVENRETIAMVADSLAGQEGVNTVVVYGIVGDKVYVSARTRLDSLHVGRLMRDAFAEDGSGGGHASMAGATLSLSIFRPRKSGLKRRVDGYIRRKVLIAAGVLKPKRKRKRKSK